MRSGVMVAHAVMSGGLAGGLMVCSVTSVMWSWIEIHQTL
jgi:hypothetical protein